MIKPKKYSCLTDYLLQYYKFHKNITLVYRADRAVGWANRCLFMGDNYKPKLPYNHRTILDNEVVIEFDEKDQDLNRRLADKVCVSLDNDNITYAKWKSGNKSVHVHFIINPREATNVGLLKNVMMRAYGTFYVKNEKIYKDEVPDSRKILPDLRLAGANHLIRAEYGIHEKSKRHKSLISKSKWYPRMSVVPQAIWEKYIRKQRAVILRRVSYDVGKLKDHPGFKFIASSTEFRTAEDGRERAMFVLIHAIKDEWKDDKLGFQNYIWDWYRYSGGYKMSQIDVQRKVNYHWKKTYALERFLNELLESLGRSDLVKE